MPDDPPRLVPGQQSDPQPVAGAPEWWGELGRGDLPLDGSRTADRRRSEQRAPRLAVAPAVPRSRLRRVPWAAWAFNLAVLAAAVLIICVGVGVVSLSMFLTIALLFGVPLALAGVSALLVARRSG